MSPGYALVAILIGCCAFAAWRRWTDGRAKTDLTHGQLLANELGVQLGDTATLVQFSSAFCAPCRTTRSLLERTAEIVPGVVHVEIDAESNLELVRRLDVMRTPTTLLLNPAGDIRNRVVGVPHQEQLLSAIAAVKPA